jgi:hypothetical protein
MSQEVNIKWESLEHNGPYFKYLSDYGNNSQEERLIQSIDLTFIDSVDKLTLTGQLVDYALLFAYQLFKNINLKNISKKDSNQNITLDLEKIRKNDFASVFISNFFYGRISATKPIKGFIQYLDETFGVRPRIDTIVWNDTLFKSKNSAKNPSTRNENLKKIKEKYGICKFDGSDTTIRKYDIPRPSLYESRQKYLDPGENKYDSAAGLIKREILPEDVVINASVYVEPPINHEWKSVVEDKTSEWLWKWEDNVIRRGKHNNWGKECYGYPADTSIVKINSSIERYDGARILNEKVESIVLSLLEDAKSIIQKLTKKSSSSKKLLLEIKQTICAYLLFTQGFRIDSTASSKNNDDEQVVGLCGLTCDNVKLLQWSEKDKSLLLKETGQSPTDLDFLNTDNTTITIDTNIVDIPTKGDYVWFSFKGKDQVYCNRLSKIDSNIWSLLRYLKEYTLRGNKNDNLFKGFTSFSMNTWLKDKTGDLKISAKTVRTQVASKFMNENLEFYTEKYKENLSEPDKKREIVKLIFEKSNLDVAKFLNHKKSSKSLQANDLSNWNLDTSINRYIDPRIIVSWCNKNEFNINDIFTKTRIDDFNWAIQQTPPGNIWNWCDTQVEIINSLCEHKTDNNYLKLLNVLYKNVKLFLISYIKKKLIEKPSQLNDLDKNFIDNILSFTK